MAKAFSLVSWNVEHFKKDPERIERVVGQLDGLAPDVFALYEVEGAEVFGELTRSMPGYTFHITEGPQVQEILVGVRSNLTAFVTQKVEYRSGVSLLRPGLLATVTVAGADYPILFLHTKSGVDPRGLGLRDDMLSRAVKFRRTLDRTSATGVANYMFIGDFNVMGMRYVYVSERSIPAPDEIRRLDAHARRYKMRRLQKTAPATWWNGGSTPPSDLDHVVAADHLEFETFDGAEVEVEGWPTLTGAARTRWIHDNSDHGILHLIVNHS
ncbi:MAG TPA: endonuclease/exonuclease/phosphatase family protein [Acidimicrobiia bacterium]